MNLKKLLGFLFVVISLNGIAQTPNIGSFSIVSLNATVAKNTEFFAQSRIHHYGVYENLNMFLVRGGITYAFHKNIKLHLGGASLDVQPFDKDQFSAFVRQNWIYEELFLNLGKSSGFKMTNRFRQENRFITPNDRSGTRRKNIFRYRMQFSQALGSNAYIKVFDEVFYNMDSKEISHYRYRGGIGMKMTSEMTVEFGYVKEGINGVYNNYVVSQVVIKSDFRRAKNYKTKEITHFKEEEINPINGDLPIKEGLEHIVPDVPHTTSSPTVKIKKAPVTAEDDTKEVEVDKVAEKDLVVEEVAEKEVKVVKVKNEVKKEVAKPKVVKPVKTYHIITGSFSEQKNLKNHLEKLNREGYTEAKNIGSSPYFSYRVSVKEFTNLEEARTFLNKIKKQGYSKAWLLIKEK